MAARSSSEPTEPGFRGPDVCKLIGISYRQLDYWARTKLVTPSVRPADGSGSQRLYSFSDLVELRIIKRLLDAGISLQRIREAIGYLREEAGGRPLTDVTLMSDGKNVFKCYSAEEVVNIVQKGQGVFGIAVGQVWADTEGEVAALPTSDRPAAVAAEPEPEAGSGRDGQAPPDQDAPRAASAGR